MVCVCECVCLTVNIVDAVERKACVSTLQRYFFIIYLPFVFLLHKLARRGGTVPRQTIQTNLAANFWPREETAEPKA